jgi:hypothetical protein
LNRGQSQKFLWTKVRSQKNLLIGTSKLNFYFLPYNFYILPKFLFLFWN